MSVRQHQDTTKTTSQQWMRAAATPCALAHIIDMAQMTLTLPSALYSIISDRAMTRLIMHHPKAAGLLTMVRV